MILGKIDNFLKGWGPRKGGGSPKYKNVNAIWDVKSKFYLRYFVNFGRKEEFRLHYKFATDIYDPIFKLPCVSNS